MELQEPLDNETNRILEELLVKMQGAEAAPEPGSLHHKDVIHADGDSAIVASALKSAGYRWIYDTRTGERSLTNVNMLPKQLQKRREDGSPVFTVEKPRVEPPRGTNLCLLHVDHPERARFDVMGLPTCRKGNLMGGYHVKRHMEKRHRQEWLMLEEERLRQEKEDERGFQRAVLLAAAEHASVQLPVASAGGPDPLLARRGPGRPRKEE